MPIYEFECKIHGKFEVLLALNLLDSVKMGYTCPIIKCIELCERIWSAPANIQIGKPTRVFQNPSNGKTIVASSDYDKPPFGYIETQLKGPVERSKFEKEEQRKLDITNEIVTRQLEDTRLATKKNRHDDIKANMSRLAAESDNPSGAEAFIKSAMNRKKKSKHGARKSEVKLAVNHNNANNLSEAK